MGFSVSATFLVFFIAFLAIGSVCYQSIIGTFEVVSNGVKAQHKMLVMAQQTGIHLANITVNGSSSNYELTLTLENTGSTTLDPRKLSILIDGNMQSNNLVNATWYPKESITITYTLSSSTGDHRVKVVTENGISAYGNYTTTE